VQLALGYVKSRWYLGAMILGATSVAQLDEDIAAATTDLDAATLAEIAQLQQRYPNPAADRGRSVVAPQWAETRDRPATNRLGLTQDLAQEGARALVRAWAKNSSGSACSTIWPWSRSRRGRRPTSRNPFRG
jgi:hypothetical protein